MWTARNHDESAEAAAAGGTAAGGTAAGRRGLHGAIDEIVGAVLDAADLDILEELGEARGARYLGLELLEELMIDMFGRYLARIRRQRWLDRKREGA